MARIEDDRCLVVTLEERLAEIVAGTVRKVLREELGSRASETEYLSIGRAAQLAEVSPATIRAWQDEGKLPVFHAGRERRCKRADLEALLSSPPAKEVSPEEAARRQSAADAKRRNR